jgi:hypothetical protein
MPREDFKKFEHKLFFFFFGEIIKEGYLGLNRTVFGGLYWTGFRRPRLSACTGLCGPG